MGECGVRDVDTLLASVRDPGSRRQFADAVRAYQGGAFRAAIISTWVAVALDLVGKLRELADDGDQGAVAELASLESAIATKDVSKLQKFENGLLDMCRDQFELLSGRDHDVLSRLMSDRNICAHPAFVSSDAVFSPSAEEARAHLASAVDSVLQHPPTPGKRLVQRFIAEIGGSAWPGNRTDLVDYLAERYFGQQRESARRQLAELIIKCSLDLPPEVPNRERLQIRYPQCARALNDVSPTQFDEAITNVVRKKEETVGLTEDEIRRGVGAFGDVSTFWIAIPSASGARVAKCIQDSDAGTLAKSGVLAASPPDEGVGAEVRAVIQQKIAEASASELVDALALRASESLTEATVARVEASTSWNTTNVLLPLLPALVPNLSPNHIARLCSAARSNYEIYQAHVADSELSKLFALTSAWPAVRQAWIDVANFFHPHKEPSAPAFTQVRAAVGAEWGAEVLS